jgi:cytoskeletal protein CcmA (bactofilin family)
MKLVSFLKVGVFASAAVFCIYAPLTEARSVVRVEETVSVAADQTSLGDLYGVGSAVVVTGRVDGDAYLLGMRHTLNGTVTADALLVGGVVSMTGEVGDDVRIVGLDVTIGGTVRGDVVVVGRSLTVLSDAVIEGDVMFFGADAVISGSVGNDVLGQMTTLRVDGPVGANVTVTATDLTLGERARIGGQVNYTSSRELTRAMGAEVTGEIAQVKVPSVSFTDQVMAVVSLLIAPFFAILVWYVLLRRSLESLSSRAVSHPLRAGLIGIITLFVVPALAFIMIASQLGILLGVVVLFIYIGVLGLGSILTLAITGAWIQSLVLPKQSFSVWWLPVGVIVMGCLLLLPAFFYFLPLALFVLSIGVIIDRVYTTLR